MNYWPFRSILDPKLFLPSLNNKINPFGIILLLFLIVFTQFQFVSRWWCRFSLKRGSFPFDIFLFILSYFLTSILIHALANQNQTKCLNFSPNIVNCFTLKTLHSKWILPLSDYFSLVWIFSCLLFFISSKDYFHRFFRLTFFESNVQILTKKINSFFSYFKMKKVLVSSIWYSSFLKNIAIIKIFISFSWKYFLLKFIQRIFLVV